MTRYELVERIGSGGMAEIFRGQAIAAGGFEKPVAIKRILPHLCEDKRFVELLIAEAHILSHLRHRNIVQIFDVGVGPDGEYFLVIEFVDGADLGRIRDGLEKEGQTLATDLGLYIGSEICEALEQAHTAPGPDGQPMRLVHRDVSPSNILLSRSGEVKLTDFGIAKRPEDVTGHGTVRGKFAYISPEQAFNGHVDARSDVFSAGIVLYELLLGQRLFSQMPDFEALRAVRNNQIPRPIQVAPHIDPRLDQLLARALARNPDDRFPSAGELGRALRELRYSLPASDGDPAQELGSLVERYVKPAGKRKQRGGGRDGAFSLTVDVDLDGDDERSYHDARQLLSEFEEEVTRSLRPGDLAGVIDDDDDATTEAGGNGSSEATVVGSIQALRRRNADDGRNGEPSGKRGRELDAAHERPTNLMNSRSGSAIEVADHEMAAYAENQGAHAGAPVGRDVSDGSLDLPTIDRSLAAGVDPLPDTLKGGVSPVPKLGNLAHGGDEGDNQANGGRPRGGDPRARTAAVAAYPSMYSQEALEQEARRRRKRMIIGVCIGAVLLVALIVVALAVDDGEPTAAGASAVDAGVSIDAAPAPIDAAPVPIDAAPKKTKPKKTVKKKPKKKRRKKKRRKKPTRKKKSGKKKKGRK